MIASKNILVIAESIDVNATSGAKANMALINAFISCGYRVRILHYTRKHIVIENTECIAVREEKASINYVLSRAQRVFQRFTKINISKPLERVFGHSFTFFNDSLSISKALKKENASQYNLIVTLSQGASYRPHHALLSLPSLHDKWLAYVHDPYPFHFYPKPYDWVESGYRQKEAFFRKVSESAKYSAFPSQLLKEWMGQFFPNFLKTGLVIPHQQLKVALLQELGEYKDLIQANSFVLLHAGNLMKQRSPTYLIQAFRDFIEANPSAKSKAQLILLGPGGYHKELVENEARTLAQLQYRLKNIPFAIVNTLQHLASVNIILESVADFSPFLPGKFPHCVYSNKPILALGPVKSETRYLLGEHYPYFSEVENINKITSHIETLYKNWEKDEYQVLNRPDLEYYLCADYVKKKIHQILEN